MPADPVLTRHCAAIAGFRQTPPPCRPARVPS